MTSNEKTQLRRIQAALERFPKVVAEKQRRYHVRQKFLKATFGDLIKQVRRELRKSEKK